MFFKKDKSIHMSIPKSYELYGVTIRKLPIAKYIAVLREVNDLPSLLLGELFPEGSNLNDSLERLQNLDRSTTLALIGRLLDPYCENPLSLSELAEIIQAFWEINDMSDFFQTVQSLSRKAAPTRSKANTGFSDGSQ